MMGLEIHERQRRCPRGGPSEPVRQDAHGYSAILPVLWAWAMSGLWCPAVQAGEFLMEPPLVWFSGWGGAGWAASVEAALRDYFPSTGNAGVRLEVGHPFRIGVGYDVQQFNLQSRRRSDSSGNVIGVIQPFVRSHLVSVTGAFVPTLDNHVTFHLRAGPAVIRRTDQPDVQGVPEETDTRLGILSQFGVGYLIGSRVVVSAVLQHTETAHQTSRTGRDNLNRMRRAFMVLGMVSVGL